MRPPRTALWLAFGLLLAATGHAALQAPPAEPPTAGQIVERNAAARGGTEAWKQLQAMAWSGHVENASTPSRHMPFLLEQKRPDRTRFELANEMQKSVRIYDGKEGWKMRTGGGPPALEPYSADELAFARAAQVIDGPLMDSAAKGHAIAVEGSDEIDGRKAFRLSARQPSGLAQTVWVDAENYLEVRMDRAARDATGKALTVSVYYRNYKDFDGLKIPLLIETRGADTANTSRLVIDRIALNPTLEDQQFSKPRLPGVRRNGVVVDTRGAPSARRGE